LCCDFDTKLILSTNNVAYGTLVPKFTHFSYFLTKKSAVTKLLLTSGQSWKSMKMQPQIFWFSSRDRFPKLLDLAIRYLFVVGNSVNAERSVSQCALVNAPRRQNFTDQNLELHAI